MKKLGLLVFALILCLSLIVSLPACGKVTEVASSAETIEPNETDSPENEISPETLEMQSDYT